MIKVAHGGVKRLNSSEDWDEPSVNKLQLISALLVLSKKVSPTLLLHVIAREYDLAI